MSASGNTTSLPRNGNCSDSQEPTTVARSKQTSLSKGFEHQNRARHKSINIHDLSFILHPAHEASTPRKTTSPSSTSDGLEHGKSLMIARASHALGVTPHALEIM
jgi:hypothetical protein